MVWKLLIKIDSMLQNFPSELWVKSQKLFSMKHFFLVESMTSSDDSEGTSITTVACNVMGHVNVGPFRYTFISLYTQSL